jgi:outer membrane protein OmpA-like peptidoglycan-associated protein
MASQHVGVAASRGSACPGAGRYNQRAGALGWASALALAVLVGGCDTMSTREKDTAKAAAVGAAAGAVLSSVTGGKPGTGAVLGGVAGAVAGNVWSRRMEDKRAAMERATAGTGIEVQRTPDNQLKVSVPSDLSFDSGRANLRPDLRPVLDQFAQGLDPSTRVLVVGHTDSTGSQALNEQLSLQRAQTVRDYLYSRGVPAARLAVVGRAALEPVADNATPDGRAKNRRVEIFLREPPA